VRLETREMFFLKKKYFGIALMGVESPKCGCIRVDGLVTNSR